jgi:hypothetical protein
MSQTSSLIISKINVYLWNFSELLSWGTIWGVKVIEQQLFQQFTAFGLFKFFEFSTIVLVHVSAVESLWGKRGQERRGGNLISIAYDEFSEVPICT